MTSLSAGKWIHYFRGNESFLCSTFACGADELIHILIFREIIRHDPCEWVMSRTWTSHVTCEWVMSRTCTSHVACEWVMSRICTSHVACEWVMSRICTSCVTCEWVMSHIRMRHVTLEWVTTHMSHDPRDMAYFPSYFSWDNLRYFSRLIISDISYDYQIILASYSENQLNLSWNQ